MSTSLEERALTVIRSSRVSAAGLAAALGVSARTAARAVAEIRARGRRISVVREGRRWYYLLADEIPRRERHSDPLLGLVGFVDTGIVDGAVDHDHYVYGSPKGR